MKTFAAREAKNRFGEFLDIARREPVLVTRNDRPVGVFLSIEDAAETLVIERFMEPEVGHDAWLTAKVGATLARVDAGEETTLAHDDVLAQLAARIAAMRASGTGA